jgi:23S rRNA (cytidine1920-2'-O)/16S rRNA (cytidine1409-2'-O)-methyltransferase
MDVSFISTALVLPAVVAALAEEGERWRGEAVILVKPQFEAGREFVGKGGIVRDAAGWKLAVERVSEAVRELQGEVVAVMDSPILGMEGNHEFLLWARWGGGPADSLRV